MWTSMAIHGDQTVTRGVDWPKFNETNDINLNIDIPFSIGSGLKKSKCDWWLSHPFNPNNVSVMGGSFFNNINVDSYDDIFSKLLGPK